MQITPLPDSTVRVAWHTDEPSDSTVDFGTAPQRLDSRARDSAQVTSHIVVLADLDPNRQYYLRLGSTDGAGNSARFPVPAVTATGYVTSPPGVVDQTRVGFRTGSANGSLVIQGTGLADLTLSGLSGTDGARASGTLTSRVLDAHQTVAWRTAQWDADVASDARLSVKVRGGNTPAPDASWSAWTAVTRGGRLTVPAGRYLQYEIEMTAGETAAPVLHWIGFTHDGSLPGSDRKSPRVAG